MFLKRIALIICLPLLTQATPAPNNGWWAATPIVINGGQIQGNTTGNLDTTGGYPLPEGCEARSPYAVGSAGSGPDLWYVLTLTQETPLHAAACGSSYDTMLGIWDANLTLLSANDDWCGEKSQTCCLVPPGTYYISIDGHGPADAGNFKLHVNYSDCTSAEAPVEDPDPPTVGAVDQPGVFKLNPGQPNPFNPETVLTFSVPETGLASLKVYDLAGREVATLLDGMAAAGTQTVRFQANHLSSGVYFAVLRAGQAVSTQKLLLVK